jgi:hypothetical protein
MNIKPAGSTLARLLVLSALSIGSVVAQDLVVVNGKAITTDRLEEVVRQFVAQGRPDTAELRALIREQLILRELFAQEAERKGLAKSAEVARQLEQSREDILIRAVIQDHLSNVAPVSDEEVRKEYERARSSLSSRRVSASRLSPGARKMPARPSRAVTSIGIRPTRSSKNFPMQWSSSKRAASPSSPCGPSSAFM